MLVGKCIYFKGWPGMSINTGPRYDVGSQYYSWIILYRKIILALSLWYLSVSILSKCNISDTLECQEKSLQTNLAACVWILSAMYEYTIAFRPTTEHGNADALSRLYLMVTPPLVPQPAEMILLMEQLNDLQLLQPLFEPRPNTDTSLSWVRQFVHSE